MATRPFISDRNAIVRFINAVESGENPSVEDMKVAADALFLMIFGYDRLDILGPRPTRVKKTTIGTGSIEWDFVETLCRLIDEEGYTRAKAIDAVLSDKDNLERLDSIGQKGAEKHKTVSRWYDRYQAQIRLEIENLNKIMNNLKHLSGQN